MPKKPVGAKLTPQLVTLAQRQNAVLKEVKRGRTLKQIAEQNNRKPQALAEDIRDLIDSTRGATRERLQKTLDPEGWRATQRLENIAKARGIGPGEVYEDIAKREFDSAVTALRKDRFSAETRLRRRLAVLTRKTQLEKDLLRRNIMTASSKAIKNALAKFGIDA